MEGIAALVFVLGLPGTAVLVGLVTAILGRRWVRALGMTSLMVGLLALALTAQWFGWLHIWYGSTCYDSGDDACGGNFDTFLAIGWFACIGLAIVTAIAASLGGRKGRIRFREERSQ